MNILETNNKAILEPVAAVNKRIIVTVDGHAGSGKSTMSAELAGDVGYAYIDTGAMYRAVTLYALAEGLAEGERIDVEGLSVAMDAIRMEFRPNAIAGRSELWLNGICAEPEIRSIEVGRLVSYVAAIPFVRKRLVAMQQALGRDKGVVMDGRDVGTVIFPEAELKVFVTASPEIRARRRFDELRLKGDHPSFAEVLENVRERDRIDETRADSPLRRAEDALLLDNSEMSRTEQRQWMLDQFHKAVERCEG
jgi:cytidylate kinase